MILKDLKGI